MIKKYKLLLLSTFLFNTFYGININNYSNNLFIENTNKTKIKLEKKYTILADSFKSCIDIDSYSSFYHNNYPIFKSKDILLNTYSFINTKLTFESILSNKINKQIIIKQTNNEEKIEGSLVSVSPIIIRSEFQDIVKDDNNYYYFENKINLNPSNTFFNICKLKKTVSNNNELSFSFFFDLKSFTFNIENEIEKLYSLENKSNYTITFKEIFLNDKIILKDITLYKNSKLFFKIKEPPKEPLKEPKEPQKEPKEPLKKLKN